MRSPDRPLMRVLAGESVRPPPLWLMRQAGRYLPEYRAVRREVGSFLDLCLTPDRATEVTLQPIRRFGVDAAILFSDILVIPNALGQAVRFDDGVGPRLVPIDAADLTRLASVPPLPRLAPVFEAVAKVRAELPRKTALLGFCGAPWTVASYMIAGHGTPDQAPARRFAFAEPQSFTGLIDLLTEASAAYLVAQLQAGADAVQIFDSFAGSLDDAGFEAWVVEPTRRIVAAVREAVPGARIIGFPKGAGLRLARYAEVTGVDAVSLDWSVPLPDAAALQRALPVQGNLEPMRLVVGGAALEEGVGRILATLGDGPHIFNLGHGILPQTPIEHVEALVALVRGARS